MILDWRPGCRKMFLDTCDAVTYKRSMTVVGSWHRDGIGTAYYMLDAVSSWNTQSKDRLVVTDISCTYWSKAD